MIMSQELINEPINQIRLRHNYLSSYVTKQPMHMNSFKKNFEDGNFHTTSGS